MKIKTCIICGKEFKNMIKTKTYIGECRGDTNIYMCLDCFNKCFGNSSLKTKKKEI